MIRYKESIKRSLTKIGKLQEKRKSISNEIFEYSKCFLDSFSIENIVFDEKMKCSIDVSNENLYIKDIDTAVLILKGLNEAKLEHLCSGSEDERPVLRMQSLKDNLHSSIMKELHINHPFLDKRDQGIDSNSFIEDSSEINVNLDFINTEYYLLFNEKKQILTLDYHDDTHDLKEFIVIDNNVSYKKYKIFESFLTKSDGKLIHKSKIKFRNIDVIDCYQELNFFLDSLAICHLKIE